MLPKEEIQLEKCPQCHLPKCKDGVFSLTQWISLCSCDLTVPEEDKGRRDFIVFCSSCKKRIIKAREGSFTQWIFRSDLCSCEKPEPIEKENKESEKESQPEYVEVVEEDEIDIGEPKFPVERFKPIGVLGHGSSGSVYLCRDKVLNKKVAVKCLNYASNELLVSFQQEARVNSKMEHPYIAKVIDFGVYEASSPYMVVEYIEGLSLEHYLSMHGAPDMSMAVQILLRICNAIEYAHRQGIYHRDIKPGNILFVEGDNASISIIDFGLAKSYASDSDNGEEELVVGTPKYMAPELAAGKSFDQRSEVYSIGCVAFELFTGSPVFEGESALEVLNRHANEKPPAMSTKRPDIEFPSALEDLIGKCLQKDPEDRFQSVEELKSKLESLLHEELLEISTEEQKHTQTELSDEQHTRKSLLTLVIPFCILMLVVYYFSSQKITAPKKVMKAPEEVKKLVNPHSKNFSEFELIGEEVKFNTIDGFTHPSNMLGFKDESMKAVRGKNFKSLSFYGLDIDGSGFKYLKDEPIERLSLDHSQITDESLKTLHGLLPNLSVLYMEYTNITDKGIENLGSMPDIVDLTMNGDKGITDKVIPLILKNFPNLHTLSLLGTSVTDNGVVQLKKHKNLKNLYLNNTVVTDRSVEVLCRDMKLKTLLLSETLITGKSLKVIAKTKSLKEISLANLKNVSNVEILKLKKARPKLLINTEKIQNPYSIGF